MLRRSLKLIIITHSVTYVGIELLGQLKKYKYKYKIIKCKSKYKKVGYKYKYTGLMSVRAKTTIVCGAHRRVFCWKKTRTKTILWYQNIKHRCWIVSPTLKIWIINSWQSMRGRNAMSPTHPPTMLFPIQSHKVADSFFRKSGNEMYDIFNLERAAKTGLTG